MPWLPLILIFVGSAIIYFRDGADHRSRFLWVVLLWISIFAGMILGMSVSLLFSTYISFLTCGYFGMIAAAVIIVWRSDKQILLITDSRFLGFSVFPYKRTAKSLTILLYVVTFVGGWLSHSEELIRSARSKFEKTQQINTELNYDLVVLRQHGPYAHVNWCLPVLPGILIADSDEVIGPTYGCGTVKVVLFYGFGSFTLCSLYGWFA